MENSICLNMIVKDEAHVIQKTLENICSYIPISYYVISDTGSTDNTVDIIRKFFDERDIKGEIYNDEWKDFGYNRSLALKYAFKKTKYLFIFDADDKINGNLKIDLNENIDAYFFKFGNTFTYKRLLLINNQLEWSFVGVLHEYIKCNSKDNYTQSYIEGNYYIDSGKTGSRSNDPLKYHKDALILEKAYNEAEEKNEHIKVRYSFYCAQSYKDSGNNEKAIEWYKKRVELKDWEQEVYYSYLIIGQIYLKLNEYEKAIYYWSLTLDIDKERYEGIYEIISFFRKKGNYYLAYNYYLMIKHKNINLENKLFVYSPIYVYLLDYEMSVIFYNVQKYKEGIETFYRLFLIKDIDINLKLSILDDFSFYVDYFTYDLNLFESYFNFIQNIYLSGIKFSSTNIFNINKVILSFEKLYNEKAPIITSKIMSKNKKVRVMLSITTCKRYDLFSRTIDSFLSCCLDIDQIDMFFCVDDNSDKIDREKMLRNYPFFKYYYKGTNEKGHLNSMNIIWEKLNILKPKYWIHLEDDWLFVKPCHYIEKSISFLEKYANEGIHQILFNKNYAEIISDYQLVGGKPLEKGNFLLHIKDEQNLNGYNSAYWPHYSFRPSICLVDTILKLGNYNSANTFFERDYADKYFENGYKSAFFNEIMSIHIGKLTSSKFSNNQKNAYELNEVDQFNDEFIFLAGYDYFGYDINFKPNLSLEELKQNFMQNDLCIAFNSLGYFKDSVDITKLIKFSTNDIGLYISVNRFNKKYNCSIKNLLYGKENNKLKNKYIIIKNNNLDLECNKDIISLEKDGYKINLENLTEDNCYLKLKNVDSTDKDYELENYNSEYKGIISDYSNDYVAYTSNGFYKKNINFESLITTPTIYDSWIYINLKKLI